MKEAASLLVALSLMALMRLARVPADEAKTLTRILRKFHVLENAGPPHIRTLKTVGLG